MDNQQDGLTPAKIKGLVTASAPLLAGFTLPTITLILTSDPKNLPPKHDPALFLFVGAAGLLIWSVHVAALARDRSKRTIYVAGLIYTIGVVVLLLALGFLFWPSQDGAKLRLWLIILLGAVILLGTVAVTAVEYGGTFQEWRTRHIDKVETDLQ